ncbi:MAG: primosomal protein N' [Thiomicrorhabdus sp.]|nr:primosomal protein N' [Thiomicrorhabdus sp.]
MRQLCIVNVAVPGPFLSPLDSGYLESDRPPVVGGRVWVPFRNKKMVGLVMGLSDASEVKQAKLKSIDEVIDLEPLFTPLQLKLFNWASRYYHEPIGDVIAAVLPKRLRQGESASVTGLPYWSLTELGQHASADSLAKNASRQHALFEFFVQARLSDQNVLCATALSNALEGWRPALKKLIQLGWIEEKEGSCLRQSKFLPPPNHRLNEEQQQAVNQVVTRLQQYKSFSAFLLQGITGSGKTEVYLGMIEATIAQGKQVLVLVPEIGLTPQMVARFEAQLQIQVACLHSGLNDSERHCAWHLVRTGQVKVLLGTRSAVFTPFQNLGLCIIDEEHDSSFKQFEPAPRYHARDSAVVLAKMFGAKVLMGSATPALETMHNTDIGKYGLVKLAQRYGGVKMPKIVIADLAQANKKKQMQGHFSFQLMEEIKNALDNKEQVILFQNRR